METRGIERLFCLERIKLRLLLKLATGRTVPGGAAEQVSWTRSPRLDFKSPKRNQLSEVPGARGPERGLPWSRGTRIIQVRP